MKVEPGYIHERYSGLRSSTEAPAEEGDAEEQAEEESADDGGEA